MSPSGRRSASSTTRRPSSPEPLGAIEKLSGQFEIHMASGNPSFVVETVLPRLGVSDRVGRPFGSDLVGCQKGDSRFYPAILEACGGRTFPHDHGGRRRGAPRFGPRRRAEDGQGGRRCL